MFLKIPFSLLNRWLLIFLFLSSLIICLYLGQAAPTFGQSQAVAQNSVLLIQQGLDHYQKGKVLEAVEVWQTTLDAAELTTADRITLQRYLARGYAQLGQLDTAIALFQQLHTGYQQQGEMAQAGQMLTEQAQLYSQLGQQQQAITLLCGQPIVNEFDITAVEPVQCQASSAIAIARQVREPQAEMAALGSLGNAYRLQGDYEVALSLFQQSLALAQQYQNSLYRVAILNNLGNTYISLTSRSYRRLQSAQQAGELTTIVTFEQQANAYQQEAIRVFQTCLELAQAQGDRLNELRARLNLATVYQISQKASKPSNEKSQVALQQLLDEVRSRLPDLPNTREKAYFALRLARLLSAIAEPTLPNSASAVRCPSSSQLAQVEALLNQALQVAHQIRDRPTESLALGRLGHLHECQQDYQQALALTYQAQLLAQTADSLYQWEWQLGRIFLAQGNIDQAIAAYQSSVQTLNSLRDEFANAGRDFQFDFRDTVEPVYRKLAELQLSQAIEQQLQLSRQPQNKAIANSKSLSANAELELPNPEFSAVLKTIDSLHLAELQNYLGSECSLEVATQPIALNDTKTAVFSTIFLGDRVAAILTLPSPSGSTQTKAQWLNVSAQEVATTVNDLRLKLERRSDLTNAYRKPAQALYQWLIQPFSMDLKTAQIDTLVFIHDSVLRSVPMAALYDGKQFLIEQYAIANTLSLSFVTPSQLNYANLRVLAFGLTEPSGIDGITFFDPLSQVEQEIQTILSTLPNSKGFLNADFTLERLQQEVTEVGYPVLHLATHGRFGIDSKETFLVTGKQKANAAAQLHNERLSMNQLYRIIRNLPPENTLELLTLTACETAAGSDRDALGIAGLSLQAGVRSAIASLWQVDDRATAELITHFYQNLKNRTSRAKALQLAQTNWLQRHSGELEHPGYWAAMILIGNWL